MRSSAASTGVRGHAPFLLPSGLDFEPNFGTCSKPSALYAPMVIESVATAFAKARQSVSLRSRVEGQLLS